MKQTTHIFLNTFWEKITFYENFVLNFLWRETEEEINCYPDDNVFAYASDFQEEEESQGTENQGTESQGKF